MSAADDERPESGLRPAAGNRSHGRGRKPAPDAAFDLWLERGLHAMFDDVAKEPIPQELLDLIEKDRKGE